MTTRAIRSSIGIGLFVSAILAGGGREAAAAGGKLHGVGGVGYLTLTGDAPQATSRRAGLDVYGGLRYRIGERLSIEGSVEYAANDVDARDFFASREIIPSDPDRFLRGGQIETLGFTVSAIWDYPIDRSTVGYLKGGLGYYDWVVDAIVITDPGDTGIADQVDPADLVIPDDSGIGVHLGAGARFPLGENAGLWGELMFVVINADGGSMRMIPIRVGISLP